MSNSSPESLLKAGYIDIRERQVTEGVAVKTVIQRTLPDGTEAVRTVYMPRISLLEQAMAQGYDPDSEA